MKKLVLVVLLLMAAAYGAWQYLAVPTHPPAPSMRLENTAQNIHMRFSSLVSVEFWFDKPMTKDQDFAFRLYTFKGVYKVRGDRTRTSFEVVYDPGYIKPDYLIEAIVLAADDPALFAN